MATRIRSSPEWREFEKLVARIESDAGRQGFVVNSPDKIRCKVTGRLREVDASVRTKVGTSTVLITIECRKRRPKQDVTWIEQLATKKNNIGAARTIAVSSTGFSSEAHILARHHGIELRHLSDVSIAQINQLIKLDFVLFPHKRCSIARVAFRGFQSLEWKMPDVDDIDYVLSPNTDFHAPIFRNIETGAKWSLNDLWLQVQEITNPFAEIEKGAPPVIRTACFPYPGNVIVETPDGTRILGDVLLSLALSLEVELVDLDSAKIVEYSDADGSTLQRIEFASREPGMEDWRVSLQIPKDSEDLNELQTRYDQPEHKPLK
jgi:hypothetical protein